MKLAKPYFLFWIMALIIFALTLVFYNSDEVIDINIHDTYYIIAYSHFGKLFSVLFLLIGLIYFLFNKVELFKFLTKSHIYISISCFIFYTIGEFYFKIFNNNTNSNFPLFDDLSNQNMFFSIILLLFVLAQFVFLLNLIISLIKFTTHKRPFKLN